MITLDARVLIGYLWPEDPQHAAIRDWLAAHVVEEFSASAVTLAEAPVHPIRHGLEREARAALRLLAVTPIPMIADEETEAARVRAGTGLRLPDAIVLHTAETDARMLATTDARLARAATARGIEAHRIGAAA